MTERELAENEYYDGINYISQDFWASKDVKSSDVRWTDKLAEDQTIIKPSVFEEWPDEFNEKSAEQVRIYKEMVREVKAEDQIREHDFGHLSADE